MKSVSGLLVSPGPRPLNSVGLPHYNTLLLSSWASQLESVKVSTAPMKIPLSVLSTIKTNDGIAYAPLPRELKGRRNMIAVAAPKDQGRFRSGKQSDASRVTDVTIAFLHGSDRIYYSSRLNLLELMTAQTNLLLDIAR
jgi:hypothetical protein